MPASEEFTKVSRKPRQKGGIFTLPCADCGASLEIAPDMDTFICDFCGRPQVVQRSGGLVSLKSLAAGVRPNSAHTASYHAIDRLVTKQLELGGQWSSLRSARDRRVSRGTFFIAVGHFLLVTIEFGILAWLSTDRDHLTIFLSGTLIFAIIAGSGMWWSRKWEDSVDKEDAPGIDAIEKRLASVEDQLERHSAIVANPPPDRKVPKPKKRRPRYR